MIQQRRRYQKLRKEKLGAAIFIQSMLRMMIIKQNYKKERQVTKTKSMTLIKRYIKGFKVHKIYQEIRHRDKIQKLMNHFKAMQLQLYTSAQIKIRYHWLKYKKRRDKKREMEKQKKLVQ